jgi:hypothetical protein
MPYFAVVHNLLKRSIEGKLVVARKRRAEPDDWNLVPMIKPAG